jgi:hypothetical protein
LQRFPEFKEQAKRAEAEAEMGFVLLNSHRLLILRQRLDQRHHPANHIATGRIYDHAQSGQLPGRSPQSPLGLR